MQVTPSQGHALHHQSSAGYLTQMSLNEPHQRHAQSSQGGMKRQEDGQQYQASSLKAHGYSPARNKSRKERESQHGVGQRTTQRHQQQSNQRGSR